MGLPIMVRVHVHHDTETNSYWADSPDLDGLVVSGANLDELRSEVMAASNELLSLALRSKNARATTEMLVRDTTSLIAT